MSDTAIGVSWGPSRSENPRYRAPRPYSRPQRQGSPIFSTAEVDAAKESEILASLRAAVRGRTTLLVTHRLRAAQDAEWVVVLDEGRLVEQGRHPELVAAGGLYARLWRVQQIEDELARA